MKEIIYIQAGNLSNHVGTHFWNTQESYFTYDADSEPLVDHDVSFREGLSDHKEQTYCPRVLIFDHKSNFGPLSKYNELYADIADPSQSQTDSIWKGAVTEYRQNIIPKSEYQRRLEHDEVDVEHGSGFDTIKPSDIRYWSDFNRVYYIPRSIQQVPDLPDWQANRGDWNHGRGVFKKYDMDNLLNEESLRQFLEESNNSQGFQVSFDNSSFGGFTVALLETIRDELPKASVLAIPAFSGVDPGRVDVEDVPDRKLALQDAACICALDELATQNIPVQSPSRWRLGEWSDHLQLNIDDLHQSSAVLSAHIESATLPLRMKGTQEDLSDLCSRLNWPQNTRFSHISGVLPFRDEVDLGEVLYDFSTVVEQFTKNTEPVGFCLVQRNVSRGLSTEEARKVETYFTSNTGLKDPYLSSVHAPAYPLPTSFPNIFRTRPTTTPPSGPSAYMSKGKEDRSSSLLSILCTTVTTSRALRGYTALVRTCVSRRYSGLGTAGLEADELREMVERLEALTEAYADADMSGKGGGREEGEDGLDEAEEIE